MVMAAAANKAAGDPLGVGGDEEGGGMLSEYSYNAKANALLFSIFSILAGIGATGAMSKCEGKLSVAVMGLVFVAGLLVGGSSSDYPIGEGSKSALHTRGFFMLFTFGLVPVAMQLLLMINKSSRNVNAYLAVLAMGGLLGNSMGRLSVDLNSDWTGHEIHVGWHSSTVALAAIAFLISAFSSFSVQEVSGGKTCGSGGSVSSVAKKPAAKIPVVAKGLLPPSGL